MCEIYLQTNNKQVSLNVFQKGKEVTSVKVINIMTKHLANDPVCSLLLQITLWVWIMSVLTFQPQFIKQMS